MRIVFLILLLILTHISSARADDHKDREILYWVAPMDPNYRQDRPGKSPMGMDLVPVYAEDSESTAQDAPENAIRVSPAYRQALGVKTVTVAPHEFGRHIRAFGKLVPSTRLEYAVDVRAKGWIVDLPVDAIGDTVQKGDLLFTYYSPDLMTAQSDFLLGSRVGNAEQRLRLYGMDEKAIAALKKKGRFLEKTPFYAPANGTITRLNVRKGSHVNEGGQVLTLQDFSTLWVEADVPLHDVQFLETGTLALITSAETGAHYKSTVDFIHPVSDPQTRTVKVRLLLDNPDGVLKPDSYVDTVFSAESQKRLAVPEEAVLYGGHGAYIIEALAEGYFRPVMVETGMSADGWTEITHGLSAGQNIVSSGQFMLDSESTLRGGFAQMGPQNNMGSSMENSHAHH